MKRARTPSAAIPRKKVKRTKSFKMIPSKSLVFQANTVGAGPERKNIDSNLVGVSGVATPIGLPDWSPTITLLNGVAQGATEVTRVGRKITMTKITMNWNVAMPSAALGGGSLRFKVVYDKQTNGAAPSILGVFTVDNFYSHNNLANADRYITLFDHITDPLCVQGNLNSAGKLSKKLSLETVFSGTAGTVASIASGSIYLFVSQSGGITTSSPNFFANIRIRFIDT